MAHAGLNFGLFMAPFHRPQDNPTLAFERDMELVEWVETLGFDEAWFGEHHSGGWETFASPELTIMAAAGRTKRIMLGSGVTSLPYHNPFMVAQRFCQLDHITRGRVMLGVGPGALPSDAYMLGIAPELQRTRMMEALDVIMALLKCEEPVTAKTDWFELRDARLHLAPYTYPHFHVAAASTITPSGMIAAGKHGLGILALGAGLPGGPAALPAHWKIAEDTAAEYGKTVSRKDWRLVLNIHVAEEDDEALRQVAKGEREETIEYFEKALGRPPGRSDDPLKDGVKAGTTLVGSPDTVAAGIERFIQFSQGGFGAILFRTHEWANRADTMKSYELFARYVMPRFQNSTSSLVRSFEWVRDNRKSVLTGSVQAIQKAYADAGKALPEGYEARVNGIVDFQKK